MMEETLELLESFIKGDLPEKLKKLKDDTINMVTEYEYPHGFDTTDHY